MSDALSYLTPEHLSTYFLFFIPGFIAMQIGALIVPASDTDFSKRVPIAVGYSALNFAFMSIVLLIPDHFDWSATETAIRFAFIFILPILYPFVFRKVREKQWLGITTPFPTAWDEFFSRRREYWVRVHLKESNDIITGWFGQTETTCAAASQYPEAQQLYLAEVWETDANNQMTKVPGTAGMIVSMSEVKYLEFLY